MAGVKVFSDRKVWMSQKQNHSTTSKATLVRRRLAALGLLFLSSLTFAMQTLSPILLSHGIPTRSLGGKSTFAVFADRLVGANEFLPWIFHPSIFIACVMLSQRTSDWIVQRLIVLTLLVSSIGSCAMVIESGLIPIVH